MNSVILVGRLIRDPEIKYTQNGVNKSVARFTLAVDRGLSKEVKAEMTAKGQPTTDFIQIVAWGKLAENVSKFTEKGKRVIVSGRIQTGSYNNQEGKTVYTTDIVASNVEFLDWKESGATNGTNEVTTNQGFDDFSFSPSDSGRIPF